MVFDIKLNNGHWTVNGKKMEDLDVNEQDFMNRFFRETNLKNPTRVKDPDNNPLVRRVHYAEELTLKTQKNGN